VVTISLLALFVLSLSWGLVERDQVANFWQEQASFLPFNNSTPTYQPRSKSIIFEEDNLAEENNSITDQADAVTDKMEELAAERTVESELPAASETPTNEAKNPVATPETKRTPEVVKEKQLVPNTKLYYIVAGSFSNEINANKLVASLRQNGFEAFIADTTKNGMFRVAYLSTQNLADAKEQLYAIRQEDNPDAWIFRK
jgi:cell division septation protein DedD